MLMNIIVFIDLFPDLMYLECFASGVSADDVRRVTHAVVLILYIIYVLVSLDL